MFACSAQLAVGAEFSPGPPHKLKKRWVVVNDTSLEVFSSKRDIQPKWSYTLIPGSYRILLTSPREATADPVDLFLIPCSPQLPIPAAAPPLRSSSTSPVTPPASTSTGAAAASLSADSTTPPSLPYSYDPVALAAATSGSLHIRTEELEIRIKLITALRARLLPSLVRERLAAVADFSSKERDAANAIVAEKNTAPP